MGLVQLGFNMPKIKIKNFNRSIDARSGETILDALDRVSIPIETTCGGHAACGKCLVTINEGEDGISELGFEEKNLLGNVFHVTKERLACQCRVHGDIEITIENVPVTSPVIKKTKDDQVKQATEKEAERAEKDVKDKDWHRFWEKDGVSARKGGGKRPHHFTYDEEESAKIDEKEKAKFRKNRE